MPVTTSQAYRQIERLNVLPYPPTTTVNGNKVRDAAAMQELVTALQSAENEFHASAVISEFTQYSDRWPTPADIRRMIVSTRAPKAAETERRCDLCQGTGYKPIGILVTTERRGEQQYKSKDRMIVRAGTESYATRFMDTFAELRAKLGPDQQLYQYSERCLCKPPVASVEPISA